MNKMYTRCVSYCQWCQSYPATMTFDIYWTVFINIELSAADSISFQCLLKAKIDNVFNPHPTTVCPCYYCWRHCDSVRNMASVWS